MDISHLQILRFGTLIGFTSVINISLMELLLWCFGWWTTDNTLAFFNLAQYISDTDEMLLSGALGRRTHEYFFCIWHMNLGVPQLSTLVLGCFGAWGG